MHSIIDKAIVFVDSTDDMRSVPYLRTYRFAVSKIGRPDMAHDLPDIVPVIAHSHGNGIIFPAIGRHKADARIAALKIGNNAIPVFD